MASKKMDACVRGHDDIFSAACLAAGAASDELISRTDSLAFQLRETLHCRHELLTGRTAMVPRKPSFNPIAHKLSASTPAVSVVWYSRQEWNEVKAGAADAEVFEATFEEWLSMAKEAFRDFQAAGLNVEKVLVNADEFAAWCMVHNKLNNGASRLEFVAQQGHKRASPRA